MQLKRCFLSIHQAMLNPPYITMPDNETAMRAYWDELYRMTTTSKFQKEYTSGALALEVAPTTGTIHIQGYLEHKRKRFATIASDLLCITTNGISVVNNAQGSWNYCAGLGEYEDKPVLARLTWGEPKLHGSVEPKAELKKMVQQIIDGASLTQVMKANPYGWAVHRDRLIRFHDDWMFGIEQYRPAEGSADIRFGKKE